MDIYHVAIHDVKFRRVDKVEKRGGGGGGGGAKWRGQCRSPLLQQLGGMGERCKLPHRGLGPETGA